MGGIYEDSESRPFQNYQPRQNLNSHHNKTYESTNKHQKRETQEPKAFILHIMKGEGSELSPASVQDFKIKKKVLMDNNLVELDQIILLVLYYKIIIYYHHYHY